MFFLGILIFGFGSSEEAILGFGTLVGRLLLIAGLTDGGTVSKPDANSETFFWFLNRPL